LIKKVPFYKTLEKLAAKCSKSACHVTVGVLLNALKVMSVRFSEGCPQLQHLDLSWCVLVTNNGTMALAKGCLNLQHLLLRFCKLVGYFLKLVNRCGAKLILKLTIKLAIKVECEFKIQMKVF
jgi:F-box/leucine-rich repeat protein 2/20